MSGAGKRPLEPPRKKGGITWDEQNLEENERIKKELNPRKIDEPKTPYLSPMDTDEEGDLGTHMGPLSLEDAAAAAAEAKAAAEAVPASAGTTSDEAGPSGSGRGRGRHVRIGGRSWSDSDRTVSPSPRHPDGGSPGKAARSPRFALDQYYEGLEEHEEEDEAAAADPQRQEKRRRFKEARKQHYNMREQLQRARELLEGGEEDEAEELTAPEREQGAGAAGPARQQPQQQQQRPVNGLAGGGADVEAEHLDADVESEHEGGSARAGLRGGRGAPEPVARQRLPNGTSDSGSH